MQFRQPLSSDEYVGRSPEGMAGRLGSGPALGPPRFDAAIGIAACPAHLVFPGSLTALITSNSTLYRPLFIAGTRSTLRM